MELIAVVGEGGHGVEGAGLEGAVERLLLDGGVRRRSCGRAIGLRLRAGSSVPSIFGGRAGAAAAGRDGRGSWRAAVRRERASALKRHPAVDFSTADDARRESRARARPAGQRSTAQARPPSANRLPATRLPYNTPKLRFTRALPARKHSHPPCARAVHCCVGRPRPT